MFFLSLTLSIVSLNQSFRPIDMFYENNQGEKGVTTYDYDGDQVRIALWHLLDGSRGSINIYEYDNDDRLTRIARSFSDGMTSEKTFGYDAKGRLITEHFSRSDGKEGTVTYTYNREGHPQMALCKGLNGWFFGTLLYHCNDKGAKQFATILREKKEIGAISYNYDEHGLLVKEIWRFGSDFEQTFSYRYEAMPEAPPVFRSSNVFLNLASNSKVKRETYEFEGKGGGPSHFTYNENKLVKKVFKRSDGLETVTHFLYHLDGRLYKSYRIYSDQKAAIFSYDFTKDGKLTERTFQATDGSKGVETYSYHPDNRLTSAKLENFDNWINGTLTFDYKEGRLHQAQFQGSGPRAFQAKLNFDFSSANLLNEIRWDFSFGGSQTYRFEYFD